MKRRTRPWIALFSHTGKEIKDLCTHLDTYPDLVCTTNPDSYIRGWCGKLIVNKNWPSERYKEAFDEYENPLITLHGWMKIVPDDICNDYEIYNGHPALVNEYPDLKGKDMQLAVVNQVEKYPYIGSIIHKCTPELDSGEIVESERIANFKMFDERLIFDVLRNTSMLTWTRFLPTKLYETNIV